MSCRSVWHFSSPGSISDERWRDLLPLPHVHVQDDLSRGKVSEGRLRRSKKRIANAIHVNEIIDSLNEMSGFGEASQRH